MERTPEATIVPELKLEDESDLVCEPIPVYFSPVYASTLQPFSSSFAGYTLQLTAALFFQFTSSAKMCCFSGSTSSLRAPDSTSSCQPIGSTLPRLHCGPSSLKLQQTPSSFQLCLGQSSPWLLYGLPVLQLRLVHPPL